MFTYRNEAAFSKAITTLLRHAGWFIQRIETGSTGRGVPDIYAVSPTFVPMWIELKRVHHSLASREEIPWRPGQQAWLHSATKYHQVAITLCCFDNYIAQINHTIIYPNNIVPVTHMRLYPTLNSLLK